MAPAIRITAILIGLILCTSAWGQTIRYVDDDAAAGGDGAGWATAYKYLQDALLEPGTFDQVWVAQGIYMPDQSEHGHVTPGDREASFAMQNNLSIYGALAGGENPDTFDLADRDFVANETILSGDIGTPGDKLDNCYHVFSHPYGTNLDGTAVLDGFTITAGNANELYFSPHEQGGGMYNEGSSPTVANCTFSENSSHRGGGMYNAEYSSPTVTDCSFIGNLVNDISVTPSQGGGMHNSYSSPTVTNCTFAGNSTDFWGHGGGMYNWHSSPVVTSCTFNENSALWGGGLYNWTSSPTVAHCTFSGNSGDSHTGGGMCNRESSRPIVDHCTFSGNSASGMSNLNSSPVVTHCTFNENSASWGGGMYNDHSSPTVMNCMFSGNVALDILGGGMFNEGGHPTVTNCTFIGNVTLAFGGGMANMGNPTVTNCIFIGNSAAQGGGIYCHYDASATIANTIVAFNSSGIYNREPGAPFLRYNCVYGNTAYDYAGLPDPTGIDGNFSADPWFVRHPDDGGDGWGDDPDTSGVDEGANDDYGDLRLQSDSPCIDAGDNGSVPPDTFDLDGDGDLGELLPFDLAGLSRFVDDPFTVDTGNGTPPIVDIGAYEYQGAPILLAAHSRRDHDGTSHDLPVPLDDVLIEPRQNGIAPQVILSYDQPPVDPGCGGIAVGGGNCTSTAVLGNDLVIDMTFDANACVEVTVGDDTLRVLTHTGNVNGDDAVNVIDLQEVKNHVFLPIDATTCVYDINCDGDINVIDLQETKDNVFVPAVCD